VETRGMGLDVCEARVGRLVVLRVGCVCIHHVAA
jgi:hypothetical protein